MAPTIRDLFPAHVSLAELHEPELAEPLFPEEQAAIARAVEKRRLEFALGRTCARRALRELGVDTGALVPLPDRSVPWPAEAWGSITHADGFCAAVAASRRRVRGIGIDAEVKERVSERLWKSIAGEPELARLQSLGDERAARREATLLFSAKEAFYKAQFCATRAWVGFHDVSVTFDGAGRFELRLLLDVAGVFACDQTFEGRYVELDGHVVTGLTIDASA